MKTRYLFLLFLSLRLGLSAQEQKGVTPLAGHSSIVDRPSSITRAVVVGISDYQSPDIPDLKYADHDADAFAEWLKSPAGGSVPAANIQLLIDKKATNAAFAAALDWLVETCKEGEQAIIYFSGHGDVETKTINQLGFLLLHDSPARCYKAGAYSLVYLQDVISTLSTQNKVHVTVITDACHAGKLAGTNVNGTQATAQNLAKQFGNEVKIMSCQPNEFSLEGEQWGGGRGVFSFHLLDGLTGLADKNADGTVTLFEIGRYLEDVVPAAAAPQAQLPMTIGDRQTAVARVDAGALADLRARKSREKPVLTAIGSKGLEQVLLHDSDSLTQKRYAEFNVALQNHELLPEDSGPGRRSADELFRELSLNPDLAPLYSLMRRNFAVALQDEVQQAINALLDNDPYETNNWFINPQKYSRYPAYLARAIELLGEGHYMATSLRAKQMFFEGHNRSSLIGDLENNPARRDSLQKEAKDLLLQSFALDSEAAYVPFAIARLYQWSNPPKSDSVVLWCSRAVALAPSWLIPYLETAHEFSFIDKYDAAEPWVMKALAQDSTSYITLERLSWLRQWQFRPQESLAICDKMIALKPDLYNAYATKARTLLLMMGEFEESIRYCKKSKELTPNSHSMTDFDLGNNYVHVRRCGEAIRYCRDALSKNLGLNDKNAICLLMSIALLQLGRYEEMEATIREARQTGFSSINLEYGFQLLESRMWLQRNQLDKAETALQAAWAMNPPDAAYFPEYYALLGELKRKQGHPDAAEQCFKKAVAGRITWTTFEQFDEIHLFYGRFLLLQNRDAEAQAQFEQCRELYPKGWRWPYGEALVAAKQGLQTEALDWLERSLDRYSPRAQPIYEEPLFAKIRKTKRFKALMAKHFPDGSF